jgi:hypothetical protein
LAVDYRNPLLPEGHWPWIAAIGFCPAGVGALLAGDLARSGSKT